LRTREPTVATSALAPGCLVPESRGGLPTGSRVDAIAWSGARYRHSSMGIGSLVERDHRHVRREAPRRIPPKWLGTPVALGRAVRRAQAVRSITPAGTGRDLQRVLAKAMHDLRAPLARGSRLHRPGLAATHGYFGRRPNRRSLPRFSYRDAGSPGRCSSCVVMNDAVSAFASSHGSDMAVGVPRFVN